MIKKVEPIEKIPNETNINERQVSKRDKQKINRKEDKEENFGEKLNEAIKKLTKNKR